MYVTRCDHLWVLFYKCDQFKIWSHFLTNTVTFIMTWSINNLRRNLVTTGHKLLKHLLGHMVDTLAISWSCKAAGHTWSHLVTPGHTWSQVVKNVYWITWSTTWQLVDAIRLLVTPGHIWSLLVTYGHSWSQMVTDTYRVILLVP